MMKEKEILFFGYNYMNYCTYIDRELNRNVGKTTYCSLEFPRWMRLSRQFSARLYAKLLKIYHRRQIDALEGRHFDYVYFIHAKAMDIELVKRLRTMFPDAKFILYYWDSLKTTDYSAYIPLFDKVFSFDPSDCGADKRLTYLPLFYTEEMFPAEQPEKYDYDMAYIASITHERRYEYLVNLRAYAAKNALRLFTFTPVFSKTYVKYFFRHHSLMKGVRWKTISVREVYDVFNRSAVIMDFPNNRQTGLTMRTFETLGMKRKLVTSNELIKKEACYSPENVFITTPDELDKIPREFFTAPFKENPAIGEYSLRSWVRKQFSE